MVPVKFPANRPSPRKPLRRLKRSLFLGAAILVSEGGCSPLYVAHLGYHQAQLLLSRRPVEEVLKQGGLEGERELRLRLVSEVKAFAEAEIGLAKSASYTTFVEVGEGALVTVVSASLPDRLEPKTWWFPVVGRVPYKGYFNPDAARAEEASLRDAGYDTYRRGAGAFSTLGWFSDPVFSTMLDRTTARLAETIIHEMTHGTVFFKGKVELNENLATFVGQEGAVRFLAGRFGADSDECRGASDLWHDDRLFSRFIEELTRELRALYGLDLTSAEKLCRREEIFEGARGKFTALQAQLRTNSYQWFSAVPLNNAVILAMLRYVGRLELIKEIFSQCGSDLRELVRFFIDLNERGEDPEQAIESATTGRTGDR